MKGKLTEDRAFKEASNAHVRLNTFYAVIALLEGGTLPGGSSSADRAAERIIRICKLEADRQFQIYDAYVSQAKE
jgi:hypothetical protein